MMLFAHPSLAALDNYRVTVDEDISLHAPNYVGVTTVVTRR